MHEKRQYQRIRFNDPLPMKIGHPGGRAAGWMENLSLGGLMCRTELSLSVGESIGCEFRVFDSPLVDISASVASKVGDGLFGLRFQAGPMSQYLLQDAINGAIAQGKASILSIHDLQGRKVLRVVGGLTVASRNDFMHGVSRVGVAEIDLSEVTLIDPEGLNMCALAVARYGVLAERRSPCVENAWRTIAPSATTPA